MEFAEFKRYIIKLRNMWKLYDMISHVRATAPTGEFELDFPTLMDEVVDLLAYIFKDEENKWIDYYVFELRCGEKYKRGDVQIDGKDVPLKTIGDLWNLLQSELERKEG